MCYTKTIQYVTLKCLYLLDSKCLWSQIHIIFNVKYVRIWPWLFIEGWQLCLVQIFASFLLQQLVGRSMQLRPVCEQLRTPPTPNNINIIHFTQYGFAREKISAFKVIDHQVISPWGPWDHVIWPRRIMGCPSLSLDNKNRLLWHTLVNIFMEAALWGSFALLSWWLESMFKDQWCSLRGPLS